MAVVQTGDAAAIADDLRGSGHRFTRIPSVGGYLDEPNVTFMLAVEDDSLDDAIGCFERSAHARDVDLPPVLLERLADWRARTVRYHGATIMISELSRLHQT